MLVADYSFPLRIEKKKMGKKKSQQFGNEKE